LQIKRHLPPVLLALVFVFSGAAAGHAEDLLAIYRQAVAVSPVLARSRALLEADRTARPLARADLLPQLGLATGINRSHADITGFTPLEVDESYTGNHYSVSLTQPLFNGPAYTSLNAAEAQARAGEAGLLAAGQQLMLQVADAYFAVLQARADVMVARTQQELLKRTLDQAEAFLKVGTGDIIAVREARARCDAAVSDRVRAENELSIARQALHRLTHKPFGPLIDLGPVEPEGPRPDRAEPWVQAALDQQPEILRAREELRIARDQVTIARRGRWPRLNLDAGYSHTKGEFLPSIHRNEWAVGLNLRFPFFQGGAIAARAHQAKSLAQASSHQLDDLKDQVRLDTETAFLNLQSSVTRLNATSQARTSARTALDATRKGYQVGTRSIIDLLTVTGDFTAAERNYYVALYDHVAARIRLKAAAGVLAVKDLEAVNALLSPVGKRTGHQGKES
jgi:outer membrane protein